MKTNSYPILDHDDSKSAIIEPSMITKNKPRISENVVLCFFQDVITKYASAGKLKKITYLTTEMGKHPIYSFAFKNQTLSVLQPGIGGPFSAALLEEAISLGGKKFIICGSCGVLDSSVTVGHLLVPHTAIRDEGTSYHYLPAARDIAVNPRCLTTLTETLTQNQVEFIPCKTWTTDAIYRETPSKIKKRKEEGCLAVEMEMASLLAVAQFRNVLLGGILYSGDDVGAEKWNSRLFTKQTSTREKLFLLAAAACINL